MNDDKRPPDDALDAEIRELEQKLHDDGKPLFATPEEPKSKLDELEERANMLLSEANERKVNLPDPPDTSRIDEIEQRGQQARDKYEADRATPESDQKYYRATSVGMAAAYGFLAVPAGFFLIGLLLNKTVLKHPQTVSIMTVIGVVCGFIYMLTVLTRAGKD